jgi:hypothetical protein
MSAAATAATFMILGNGAHTVAISLLLLHFQRAYHSRMAYALLAAGIVWVVLQAVDNAHILAMVSLSRRVAGAAATQGASYQVVADSLRDVRRWVHYSELLVIDAWFLLFYGTLLRHSLVPRLLGGIGLLAVLLHALAIPLAMFIGYPMIGSIAPSLAVSHLLIGGWLLWRGFPESLPPSLRSPGA